MLLSYLSYTNTVLSSYFIASFCLRYIKHKNVTKIFTMHTHFFGLDAVLTSIYILLIYCNNDITQNVNFLVLFAARIIL